MNFIDRIQLFFIFISLVSLSCCKEEYPQWDDGYTPISPYWEPVWHPDGKIIGFNHLPLDSIIFEKNAAHPWHYYSMDSIGFWIINSNGTGQKRLVNFVMNTPAWSNKGDKIAFNQDRKLQVMPFQNDSFLINNTQTISSLGNGFFPSWSFDDSKISCALNPVDTFSSGIWVYSFQEGTSEIVCENASFSDWHNTRDSIIIVQYNSPSFEFFWIDVNTKVKTKILVLPESIDDIRSIQLSRDNETVFFSANSKNIRGRHIFQLNLLNGIVNRILTSYPTTESFSVGGDGKVVYEKDSPDDFGLQIGTLWIFDIDCNTNVQLTYNKVLEIKRL